jgi:hypothetical protein
MSIINAHEHYVINAKDRPVRPYHGGSYNDCWEWILGQPLRWSLEDSEGLAVVTAEDLSNNELFGRFSDAEHHG